LPRSPVFFPQSQTRIECGGGFQRPPGTDAREWVRSPCLPPHGVYAAGGRDAAPAAVRRGDGAAGGRGAHGAVGRTAGQARRPPRPPERGARKVGVGGGELLTPFIRLPPFLPPTGAVNEGHLGSARTHGRPRPILFAMTSGNEFQREKRAHFPLPWFTKDFCGFVLKSERYSLFPPFLQWDPHTFRRYSSSEYPSDPSPSTYRWVLCLPQPALSLF